MDPVQSVGVLLGSSATSGINLYLTVASLGIAQRFGWLHLPGTMDSIGHPLVILGAIGLYAVEFVADKIPYFDSAWDAVHTFIRPVGGAALAYMGTSSLGPAVQTLSAVASGSIALNSHLTKATTRVAINTSPEPFSNSIASVTEDGIVCVIIWMIIKHPIIASIVAVLFIALCVWLLHKMFRFVKKVLRFFFPREA
jgi:hypothetical protein